MIDRPKIVFFGTPGFAVGILKALIENNYNIVGVVTAVDKKAGRGKKLRQSDVKQYALAQEIPILQPKNLKSDEFIADLEDLKADLQIIVAFRMLPEVVWAMPKMGTFNLHASLLPAYRGAAPINWAIINGETETGVTSFFIDNKIDTGEVLLQEKVAIGIADNVADLHDTLMELGAEVVLKTVDLIVAGDYKTQKQPDKAPTNAPKLYKTNTSIDWNDTPINIYNKIRGLSPYPAAWCNLISDKQEYKLKLYKTHIEEVLHDQEIGSILTTKKTLKVAAKGGFVFIDEMQLSGKKRMDINSLLNGFSFTKDAKMIPG